VGIVIVRKQVPRGIRERKNLRKRDSMNIVFLKGFEDVVGVAPARYLAQMQISKVNYGAARA
jgi:hypothetical protein